MASDKSNFLIEFYENGLEKALTIVTEIYNKAEATIAAFKNLGKDGGMKSFSDEYKLALADIKKATEAERTRREEIKARAEEERRAEKERQRIANEEKKRLSDEEKAIKSLEAQRQKALTQIAKQENLERELVVAANMEVKSIEDLQKKNNALIAIRKRLNTTTEEGKAEYEQLTRKIADNTLRLKEHDAEIGNHQRNVGNYPKFLQPAISFLDKFKTGIMMLPGVNVALNALGSVKDSIAEKINLISTFQTSSNELSAITGATGSQLAYMEKSAIEMSNGFEQSAVKINKSAPEIIEAFKKVASAKPELLENAAALKEVTKEAIILSQAGGKELPLEQSVTSLTTIMNQFNASASQSGRYINVLAAGSKFGAAEIPYLSEAISKVGTTAESAGMNIESLTAVMELYGEKGIAAETSGQGFKRILLELQGNTKNYTNGVFDLNKAIANNKDIQDDNIKLQQRFGKEYFNLAQILFKNSDRFSQLEKQVTGTSTAYEQAERNTRGLAVASQSLSNKWDAFTLSLDRGDGFLSKTVSGMVNLAAAAVDAITPTIKLTDSIVDEQNNLNMLVEKLKMAGEGTAERSQLIAEIQKVYPGFLDNIEKEADYNKALEERLQKVNEQYRQKYNIAILDDQINTQKKVIESDQKYVDGINTRISALRLVNKLTLERQNLLKENNGQETEQSKFILERIKDLTKPGGLAEGASGFSSSSINNWINELSIKLSKVEASFKIQQDKLNQLNTEKGREELKLWITNAEEIGKKIPSVSSAVDGFKKSVTEGKWVEAQGFKKYLESIQNGVDKAKKKASELTPGDEEKKEAEKAKKAAEDLYNRYNELERLRLEVMKDSREKDMAGENKSFDERLHNFETLKLMEVGIAEKARKLIDKIDKGEKLSSGENSELEKMASENEAFRLALEVHKQKIQEINDKWDKTEIDQRNQTALAKAQIEGKSESELLDLRIKGERDVLSVMMQSSKYSEQQITEQRLKIYELVKGTYDEKVKAQDKQLALDLEFAETEVGNEEQKERRRWEIYLQYAEQRLKLAEVEASANGVIDDGEFAKIREMQEAINGIKGHINDIGIEKPDFLSDNWFMDAFEVKPEDKEKFSKGWQAVKEAVSGAVTGMMSALSDYAQSKVDAANQEVEESESRISTLEAEVEKEKELNDKGVANNLSAKQKELDAEKANQAKLIAERQKAAKQKQNIERLNLITDSISQGSNMVTASSKIWAWASAIPVAGPAIAAAVIGLMWGSFLAQKALMLSELNKTPAFKDGVIGLDGPGTSTSDSIPARLSKGESVMTAKETLTSGNLLRLIRKGEINDNVLLKLPREKSGGVVVNNDYSELGGKMDGIGAKMDETNRLLRNMQNGFHIFEDGKRKISFDGNLEIVKR